MQHFSALHINSNEVCLHFLTRFHWHLFAYLSVGVCKLLCVHVCVCTRMCLCVAGWLACGMASLPWTNVAAFSGSPEAQVSLSLFLSPLLFQHHISTRGPQDHYPITVSLPEAGLNLPPHLPSSFSFLIYSILQEPINCSGYEERN